MNKHQLLVSACENGNLELAKEIYDSISHRYYVVQHNIENNMYFTNENNLTEPLIKACTNNHYDVCKWLCNISFYNSNDLRAAMKVSKEHNYHLLYEWLQNNFRLHLVDR